HFINTKNEIPSEVLIGQSSLRKTPSNVLSIYHRYITGQSPLYGHDIMNSFVNESKKALDIDIRKNIFKMKIPDTEIEVDIEIPHIHDINEQDIENWCYQIKELIKNNGFKSSGCSHNKSFTFPRNKKLIK
ncbi:hypothetical protein DMUE_4685, partial [Dictyocoela muelleri]